MNVGMIKIDKLDSKDYSETNKEIGSWGSRGK